MIGVIADDLSGAAELGAIGLRHGLRAEILLDGAPGGGADLVCVDTDSRSCPPEEARARVRAAAKMLAGSNARWIYKKVDSVLRGNVVAELEALMAELGLELALLLPANPTLGRVVSAGRYFVHGRPINETEFARDPEHPRTSANVLELLGAAARVPLCVRSPGEALPASGIVIGEAETSGDLREWATQINTGMLAAGAAEFFEALLAAKPGKTMTAEVPVDFEPARAAELFVSGSASESALEFIQAEQRHGTPVFSLPQELAGGAEFSGERVEILAREAAVALEKHSRVILSIGLPMVREQAIARRLHVDLVRVAEMVLRTGGVGRVYAEGGATAMALARRMGWRRLTLEREFARGVATVSVEGNPALRFMLKPGTYVWPDAVRRSKV